MGPEYFQRLEDKIRAEVRERLLRLRLREAKASFALSDLIYFAKCNTRQGRVCCDLLLGVYDGERFPLNLNGLRFLDEDLRDGAIALLDWDTYIEPFWGGRRNSCLQAQLDCWAVSELKARWARGEEEM